MAGRSASKERIVGSLFSQADDATTLELPPRAALHAFSAVNSAVAMPEPWLAGYVNWTGQRRALYIHMPSQAFCDELGIACQEVFTTMVLHRVLLRQTAEAHIRWRSEPK